MEKSKMKNMVVLKNLPSNLIEEAFVIVKNNKTAKTLEYIDKGEKIIKNENNTNEYIIREAESVISNYVSVVEKKDKTRGGLKDNKKSRNLMIYSVFITIAFVISLIFFN